MKKVEYTLFSQPITRRTYYWLWFLCPFAALWIFLASRRVVATTAQSSGSASSMG
jgi:hypothetical protein